MSKADDIVEAVLDVLEHRAGFDHWWDEIDGDVQGEIKKELTTVVQDVLYTTATDTIPVPTVDVPSGDPAATDNPDKSGFGIVPDGETVEGNLEADKDS